MNVRAIAVALVLVAPAAPRAAAPQGGAPQAAETFDAAWTEVRDKHFDKTFNGVDWAAAREEFRPRALAAASTAELRVVLREMLGRLGQSHFAIIPSTAEAASSSVKAPEGSATPGFEVRLSGTDLLVFRVDPVGPAAAAGVRAGWKLSSIGGTPVSTLLRGLTEGANERLLNVEAWRIAESRLRGSAGTTVDVAFEDGAGKVVPLKIERRAEPGQPVTVGKLPPMVVRVESERQKTPAGRSAGLIRFNVWMTPVDAPVQKAVDEFRGGDGIVLDLRGNPGGLAGMLMGMAGHFIPERKALGVMKTRDNELRFVVNPRSVSASGTPVEPFAGPVAILVDGMSGSASECFAGGMQSLGRVRIFGQTSMGQALPAQFRQLPNGDVMLYAFGDFVTADGTRLEGRGVIPDEIIPLRRDDLLAGRDKPLEAALAWIDTQARGKG